jgi:hypothetical protein
VCAEAASAVAANVRAREGRRVRRAIESMVEVVVRVNVAYDLRLIS